MERHGAASGLVDPCRRIDERKYQGTGSTSPDGSVPTASKKSECSNIPNTEPVQKAASAVASTSRPRGARHNTKEYQANVATKRLSAPLKAISVMCSPPPPEHIAAKRLRELDRAQQGGKAAKRSNGASESRSLLGSPDGGSDVGELSAREGTLAETKRPAAIYGVLHPDRYLAGEECIDYQGKFITRSKFEKLGGSLMAKWYRSIRVVTTDEPLGTWLARHGLPLLKGNPRNRQPGDTKGDDDDDNGVCGSGSGTACVKVLRSQGRMAASSSMVRSVDAGPVRDAERKSELADTGAAGPVTVAGRSHAGSVVAPGASKLGSVPRSNSLADEDATAPRPTETAAVETVAAGKRGNGTHMQLRSSIGCRGTHEGTPAGGLSTDGVVCFGSLAPTPAVPVPTAADLRQAALQLTGQHCLLRGSPSSVTSGQLSVSTLLSDRMAAPAAGINATATTVSTLGGEGLEVPTPAAKMALPGRLSAPASASVLHPEPPSADSGMCVAVAGGSMRSVVSGPLPPMPPPVAGSPDVSVGGGQAHRLTHTCLGGCSDSPTGPPRELFALAGQADAAWKRWESLRHSDMQESGGNLALASPPGVLTSPMAAFSDDPGKLGGLARDAAECSGSSSRPLRGASRSYDIQLPNTGGNVRCVDGGSWPGHHCDASGSTTTTTVFAGQRFSSTIPVGGSAGCGPSGTSRNTGSGVGVWGVHGNMAHQNHFPLGSAQGTLQLGSRVPSGLSVSSLTSLNRIEMVKMELLRGARGGDVLGGVNAGSSGGGTPHLAALGVVSGRPAPPPPSHNPLLALPQQRQQQLRWDTASNFEARVEQLMRGCSSASVGSLGAGAYPMSGSAVGSTLQRLHTGVRTSSSGGGGGGASAVETEARGLAAIEVLSPDRHTPFLLHVCGAGASGGGTTALGGRGQYRLDRALRSDPSAEHVVGPYFNY